MVRHPGSPKDFGKAVDNDYQCVIDMAMEEPGRNLRQRMNTNAQHIMQSKAITTDNLKHNLLKM